MGAAVASGGAAAAPEDYLVVQAGGLPVILTAPHGGEAMAGLPRRRGGALLLDVHGQSSDVAVVFRGTQNGATVRRLLVRAGEAALSGPESVLGVLTAKGHAVIPHARSMAPEARAYLGGFTVQSYSREP